MDANATGTELDLSSPSLGATAPAGAPSISGRVDRFTVLEEIGAGAMGVVYAAYDPELDRRVALKLLRADRFPASDERSMGRVLAEARAMARVSHPNVVTVYEVGRYGAAIFVAMEFAQGPTVRRWLKLARRSGREIVDVFVALARGVEAVHAAGLVHRDIKLDNLIVRNDGRAQVLDFGIAIASDASTDGTGGLVGTPSYMAPEQFAGGPASAHTDQWALCISLYEALYGSKPFIGANIDELSRAVQSAKLPASRDRSVPPAVHAAIVRGLSLAPDLRWPSMRALATALVAASGQLRRRTRAITFVGSAAIAIGLASGVAMATREPRCDGAESALARVWNPEREAAIGAAFERGAPTYGADAWQHTARIMQAYGEAWTAGHREACEAELAKLQTPHVFDLRIRCLERRLDKVEALLGALARADADAIANSVDAAARLPAIAECSDVDALLTEVALPLPEQAEEAAALQRELDIAETDYELRHVEAYADALAKLRARIEALQYGPLIARHALLQAVADEDLGDFAGSGVAAQRAYFVARANGDHETATMAAAKHAWKAAVRDSDVERGALWLQLAEAETSDATSPDLRVALADVRASLMSIQGRDTDALAEWKSALALVDGMSGPEARRDVERATIGNNVAVALINVGRSDAAVTAAREVVATQERLLGRGHPEIARTLTTLGAALDSIGDHEAASEVHRRAVATLELALGPDDQLVAGALVYLSLSLETLRPSEASASCERALVILAHHDREQSREAAVCLDSIGRVNSAKGDERAAHAHFERALAIWESLLGPQHARLSGTLTMLGGSALRLGQLEDAEAQLRRSIAVQVAAEGEDAAGLGSALSKLGATLRASGRTSEAVEVLERALVRHLAESTAPEQVGYTAFELAQAIVASRGDLVRARELAEQARAAYRRAQPVGERELASIETWLATLPD